MPKHGPRGRPAGPGVVLLRPDTSLPFTPVWAASAPVRAAFHPPRCGPAGTARLK
jgi:hypothetical protein